MRLPGGRQAQPGVSTGRRVVAWWLRWAGVFLASTHEVEAAGSAWASHVYARTSFS
jgi:hypothetical protein